LIVGGKIDQVLAYSKNRRANETIYYERPGKDDSITCYIFTREILYRDAGQAEFGGTGKSRYLEQNCSVNTKLKELRSIHGERNGFASF
jgi:hypothetical protein